MDSPFVIDTDSPTSSHSSDESSTWSFSKPSIKASILEPDYQALLSVAVEECCRIQPDQPQHKKTMGLKSAAFEESFTLQPDKPQPIVHKNRLLVTNLPETATVEGVEAIFGSYGPIVRVRILENEATGKPKGAAIVQFQRYTAGMDLACLAKLRYGGIPLDVKWLNLP